MKIVPSARTDSIVTAEPQVASRIARRNAFVFGTLGALVLAAYFPAVTFGFCQYDDPLVFENPHVRNGLSVAGCTWAFLSTFLHYFPITWLSYMCEVELFGLKPTIFHLTNIWLHTINTILVFKLSRTLHAGLVGSFFAAAVFALHPINAETVVWVSERKGLLAGAFGLFGLLLYAKSAVTEGASLSYYYCAVVAFLLSLLSKPSLLPVIGLCYLIDTLASTRGVSKSPLHWLARRKLLLCLSLCFLLLALTSQKKTQTLHLHASLGDALKAVATAYGEYTLNYLTLNSGPPFQPQPVSLLNPENQPSFKQRLTVITLAFCALVYLVTKRMRDTLLICGWGLAFWVVGLVPVAQWLPIGDHFVADRYAYIPQIGLLYVFARVLDSPVATKMSLSRYLTRLSVGFVLLFLLVIREHHGLWSWRTSESLWSVATVTSRESWVSLQSLSNLAYDRQQYPRAYELARQSCAMTETSLGFSSLGAALHRLGRFRSSAWAFERAVALDQRNSAAWGNYARLCSDPNNPAQSKVLEEVFNNRAKIIPPLFQ